MFGLQDMFLVSYRIIFMKGYIVLSMRNQIYLVQNKNDIQCWCFIRGKLVFELFDRGDFDIYKLIIKYYRFLVIVKVLFFKSFNFCCLNIRYLECIIYSLSGLYRRG